MGLVGTAFRTAETLDQALEMLSKYLCILSGYAQASRVTRTNATLDYHLQAMDTEVDDELRRWFALSTLLCWAWVGRRLTGTLQRDVCESIVIKHPSLRGDVPSNLLPTGLVLHFGQPSNFFRSPLDHQRQSIQSSSASMHAAAIAECDRQLAQLQTDVGTATRVRSVLRVFTPFLPTAETVAQRLGVSVATMKRRLNSENMTFQEIKDAERFVLIESLLGTTDMTLDEIASMASFSDGSALAKAFRLRNNLTPGEFRKQTQHQ